MSSGDIAHLGHIEMLTDRYDESLDFFTRVYGLKLSAEDGTSAYLRAWDDYEFCSLKLTRADTTGGRATSPTGRRARPRCSGVSKRSRRPASRPMAGRKGDLGHGRAYRFEDPFGHVFEVYYDTVRFEPRQGAERPALKNTASAFTGAAPRRIDHLNLLARDVSEFRRFMETCLGSRVTEYIQLDNGRIGGCWFTVNNKTYDLACTEEHGTATAVSTT